MRICQHLSMIALCCFSLLEGKSASHHLVIQIIGNDSDALAIAKDYSLKYVQKVFPDENFYHLMIPGNAQDQDKNGKSINSKYVQPLKTDSRIVWVELQVKQARQIRKIPINYRDYDRINVEKRTNPEIKPYFNDPYYPDQWYLHNDGQTGGHPENDLNVLPAWTAGYTGHGITLSVLDDGIQHTNLDIQQNYEPSVSYDLVDLEDKNHDPTPDLSGDNSHGTYCAGIIAAVANNSICGVGVAYNAKIGGLRIMDGLVTDLQEALALVYGLHKVDIYSASWGPKDDGAHLAGPGRLTSKAFQNGIQKGRQGKGSIYVWAVGNGGITKDNCNMDGYVSSIYTVAIGALTDDGLSAYYSEPCASTLASTFVGGLHKRQQRRAKNSFKNSKIIKVVAPELDGRCTESFQGTSAAAPLAAGALALALEANPSLTWRDVQHILVHSCRIPNASETGWRINGAGHHYHLNYGFGVIDIGRMVAKAKKWYLVGKQKLHTVFSTDVPRLIYCNRNITLNVFTHQELQQYRGEAISHLEHVIATVDIIHPWRKHLEVYLQSPSGTLSQLLTERPMDNRKVGIRMWDFMSVHFWDENPEGLWKLQIADHTPCGGSAGVINYLAITFFGTHRHYVPEQRAFRRPKKSYEPDYQTLQRIMDEEKLKSRSVDIEHKRF